MRRHKFDPVALVAGLVAVLVGVGYFVGRSAEVDVSGRAVASAVLIALGLLGLVLCGVQVVRSSRRREPAGSSATGATQLPDEP